MPPSLCRHSVAMPSAASSAARSTPEECVGFCRRCGCRHGLGQADSIRHAAQLLARLEKEGRIDLASADHAADPELVLDHLSGPARGQMFGVLTYEDRDGSTGVLRAFSGQYNGRWQVAGWVPPLFDVGQWHQVNQPQEARIKELGRHIARLAEDAPQRRHLLAERRLLSQQLMKRLHGLYRLTNFRGQTSTLAEAFIGPGGMPTGTGDCCAPKLLNYAARHELRPLGISEFFLGRENRSQTRQHGVFYPSCTAKCRPILGFLLCGLKP